ncbi:MAG TPA: hypothetical protein VLH13_01005 [Methanomassiliicoccales archaeon]|nr:hypothetical protein [Methanomassiliicoccales archaeon]
MGKSYREFCQWMKLGSLVLRLLDMNVPHFTKLQKFSKRVEFDHLERFVGSFSDDVRLPVDLAVDSTGFDCTSAIQYFITVVQRNEKRDMVHSMKGGDM